MKRKIIFFVNFDRFCIFVPEGWDVIFSAKNITGLGGNPLLPIPLVNPPAPVLVVVKVGFFGSEAVDGLANDAVFRLMLFDDSSFFRIFLILNVSKQTSKSFCKKKCPLAS